jgi:3',5'-cyclic AMP phosphodiesterase CpdA
MRVLAHISDLHFGAEDGDVVEGLIDDLEELEPALVVVSGDLTQRAKRREFRAAHDFLARMPAPTLAVPGNHDVPLFDLLSRFASPFARYREWISRDLRPLWRDDEVAVLGLTTARSLTWKHGRISHDQIDGIRAALGGIDHRVFKIVVTHHHFIPPLEVEVDPLVGRARLALVELEACGVDLLLAGHLHLGFTGETRTHHESVQRSILVAQAGTAVSRRRRGEPNAYNVIAIDGDRLTISVRAWDGLGFEPVDVSRYRKLLGEWRELA